MNDLEELKELIIYVESLKTKLIAKIIFAIIFYAVGFVLMYIPSFVEMDAVNVFLIPAFICRGLFPLISAYKAGKKEDDKYVENKFVLEIEGNKAIIKKDTSFAVRLVYCFFALAFGLIVTPIMVIVWLVKLIRIRKVLKELYEDVAKLS